LVHALLGDSFVFIIMELYYYHIVSYGKERVSSSFVSFFFETDKLYRGTISLLTGVTVKKLVKTLRNSFLNRFDR
jgi:hypothetical protein